MRKQADRLKLMAFGHVLNLETFYRVSITAHTSERVTNQPDFRSFDIRGKK